MAEDGIFMEKEFKTYGFLTRYILKKRSNQSKTPYIGVLNCYR